MSLEPAVIDVASCDFDAEEVWLGKALGNADRSGTLVQATHGAKVAAPLILDLLHRVDPPATFFVPGRVPQRVRRSSPRATR